MKVIENLKKIVLLQVVVVGSTTALVNYIIACVDFLIVACLWLPHMKVMSTHTVHITKNVITTYLYGVYSTPLHAPGMWHRVPVSGSRFWLAELAEK